MGKSGSQHKGAIYLELLAHRAVFDCSLRSLRCSPGCCRFVGARRTEERCSAISLLQIGGANIENPPTSSSLASRKRSLVQDSSRASLAQHGGARFPDARSWPGRAPQTVISSRRWAAYDESMAKPDGKKRVRWSLWLAAGVLFGLAIGFVFGLARPRVRN